MVMTQGVKGHGNAYGRRRPAVASARGEVPAVADVAVVRRGRRAAAAAARSSARSSAPRPPTRSAPWCAQASRTAREGWNAAVSCAGGARGWIAGGCGGAPLGSTARASSRAARRARPATASTATSRTRRDGRNSGGRADQARPPLPSGQRPPSVNVFVLRSPPRRSSSVALTARRFVASARLAAPDGFNVTVREPAPAQRTAPARQRGRLQPQAAGRPGRDLQRRRPGHRLGAGDAGPPAARAAKLATVVRPSCADAEPRRLLGRGRVAAFGAAAAGVAVTTTCTVAVAAAAAGDR